MRNVLTFCFVLLSTLSARGQQGDFRLHSINLPERFGQQIINCLEQDKLGMLWFVTNEGVFRFDGNELVHLGPESTPKVPHMYIKALFADKNGNMWIGALDGLTRLNLKSWRATEIKAAKGTPALSLYIRSLGEDHNGVVYAGSQDGKVYKVENDSLVLIFDANLAYNNLYDLPNVTFIKEAQKGQLWIGTSVGKLARLAIRPDGSYGQPVFFGLDQFSKEQIAAANFDSRGNCLMAVTHLGLFYMNGTTGTIKKIEGPYGQLGMHGQLFLVQLNDSQTIIMTNTPGIGKEQLFIFDFRTGKISRQQLHYPRYLDDNHIVWLSHTGSKILLSLNDYLLELAPSNSPFSAMMAESKTLNSIRAVYKIPNGDLLAGSYKDGFVRYNEQTGEKKVIARKYVYSILPWNKDSMVVSTEGDGLFWFEPSKDKLTPLELPDANTKGKPMGHFLTFLLRYDTDHFLVGTYERLYKVNPYAHTAKAIREDRLLKAKVQGILKHGEDYLIATEHEILKWNAETDAITTFSGAKQPTGRDRTANGGQISVPVYGMAMVGDQIWAATSGLGIIVYGQDGRALDTIGKPEGLASSIVFTLAATDKYVLAGTKSGLSVINRQSRRVTNYSTVDQLPANEFNSGAIYQDDNQVYLGTIDGIVRFNTDKLQPLASKELTRQLYITDLNITDKHGHTVNDYTLPYQKQNGFTVPAGTAYFSIGFGSLDEPMQHLDYYYRLSQSGQWIPVGNNRKVTFIGMPPGEYALELVAKLPDDSWSKILLNVPIWVAPAFYQTLWFKILLACILAALIWAVIKYRERQAEKERALRLKIAGDLHDEIGSTLAGMSMQAEMLLSGHQQHQMAYLKNIADNGRAAVQTMGDIVWSIDPRNDDSISLFQRMERYGNKVLENSDISIHFQSVGFTDKQYIAQKIRQNVMLIYKEALTNIIKHSGASKVDVMFAAYNSGFKLFILDNGKGVPKGCLPVQGVPASGHGLRNMQMRADLMGAVLSFPAVDQGFELLLTFKG